MKGQKYIKYRFLLKDIEDISIDLVTTKMQQQNWNKLFRNISRWNNKNIKDLTVLDKAAKESISVAICNRALKEGKPKMKQYKSDTNHLKHFIKYHCNSIAEGCFSPTFIN